MIYITAVHMEPSQGTDHERITSVQWRNPNSGESGSSTREAVVSWLRTSGDEARVQAGQFNVQVGIVEASPPYLRTYADNASTDNLLALPRY